MEWKDLKDEIMKNSFPYGLVYVIKSDKRKQNKPTRPLTYPRQYWRYKKLE